MHADWKGSIGWEPTCGKPKTAFSTFKPALKISRARRSSQYRDQERPPGRALQELTISFTNFAHDLYACFCNLKEIKANKISVLWCKDCLEKSLWSSGTCVPTNFETSGFIANDCPVEVLRKNELMIEVSKVGSWWWGTLGKWGWRDALKKAKVNILTHAEKWLY